MYWSRLKITVQIQGAFHPCDPFDINYPNTSNVGKHCLVVLNEKLDVQIRLKTFFDQDFCIF